MNIHFFFPLLASLPTLALPSPQDAPPAPPAPSSPSTSSTTHTVKVGGGGPGKLYFDPQVVVASAGDVVKFDFGGLNHTLTESSFEKPCTALSGGVDASATTFEVPVKDAAASRWFYCKAGDGFHCGAGMIFALNPSAEKKFETFRANALAQNGPKDAPAGGGSPPVATLTETSPPTTSTVVAG